MEHKGTMRLESARLLLRPFTLDDAEAMYRNWASDPEVTRFLTWPTHASSEVTAQLLRLWIAQYEDPAFYQWVIELKSIAQPIGSISVVNTIDRRIGNAELGWCIGRRWWHEGITSEAAAMVIGFLFDQVGVNRVSARHDVNNPRSGLVMRRCGMQLEGVSRQAGWNNAGLCDLACYGLLRSEWKGPAQNPAPPGKLPEDAQACAQEVRRWQK